MTVELRAITPEDVPELGRVCYEAFRDIAEQHGFPPDFASPEFAAGVISLILLQERAYGVAAFDGAAARGSNFVSMWDEVAGIGPISVDPATQGEGIGRKLMEDGLARSRERGYEQVRLLQDAYNMQSIALYASLGFDTKEPVAYMALAPEGAAHAHVRPAVTADLDAMDVLCQPVYGVSRRNECAALIAASFPAFVYDDGRLRGYLIATAIGHGVAESDEIMLALLASLGARVPDAHSNLPLRAGALYRRALAAGHRNRKIMNLMALGPYEEPHGTYLPSVLY